MKQQVWLLSEFGYTRYVGHGTAVERLVHPAEVRLGVQMNIPGYKALSFGTAFQLLLNDGGDGDPRTPFLRTPDGRGDINFGENVNAEVSEDVKAFLASRGATFSTNSSKGLFVDFTFSPSGKWLAARSPDAQSVNLWEFHAGSASVKPSLTLLTNLPSWGAAAFSPDERTLALHSAMADGHHVGLFDLTSGGVTHLPLVHRDLITAFAFSPDGRTLATGGADERVIGWDFQTGRCLWTNHTDLIHVMALAFAPNGQTLFSCGWHQNIGYWNLAQPSEMLTLHGHSGGVNALAVAPDAHMRRWYRGRWHRTSLHVQSNRIYSIEDESI